MKKVVLTMMIAAGSLMYKAADAQVGISVGLNLGPVSVQIHKPVYDDFYYLPDVEAYYSVPEHVYYYMDGDNWTCAEYLPGSYRNYDWRNARRYEVRAQRPYMNHEFYRSRFGGYDRGRSPYNGGGYAYDRPQRMPQRGNYGGGFPQSPYDSNNDRGRGGNYGQPGRQRGGYDEPMNRNHEGDRGNWNNNQDRGQYGRPDNNNRGQGGYTQPNNGNRNQGGYNGEQRGNRQGGDNSGQGQQRQGDNGQQANQQNRGNWNNNNQQRFTNSQNNRPRVPGRMMF